jgi:hypothetical protein
MTPTPYFNSNILTWSRCIIFLNFVLAPSPLQYVSSLPIKFSARRLQDFRHFFLRRTYEYWFRQLEIHV